MITKQVLLTYIYLLIYVCLSSSVILYNKWVLSPKYFKFPFPITLTMIHMGFSALVAVILVRVLKIAAPVNMTFRIYATCVVPISAFFASSLWFGNTAYLHISVAFIQMLKALMPVATFLVAVVCGTDKLRGDLFLNMLLVSVGVVISSYGEIHFNVIGTVYQVTGIFAEALRLVLTQILLQKKGLTLNPITSLYYIAPCSYESRQPRGILISPPPFLIPGWWSYIPARAEPLSSPSFYSCIPPDLRTYEPPGLLLAAFQPPVSPSADPQHAVSHSGCLLPFYQILLLSPFPTVATFTPLFPIPAIFLPSTTYLLQHQKPSPTPPLSCQLIYLHTLTNSPIQQGYFPRPSYFCVEL